MCHREIQNDDTFFYPGRCYQAHGSIAHKTCNECWWNFADENANHQCPGCLQHLPLSRRPERKPISKNTPILIIDDDDD